MKTTLLAIISLMFLFAQCKKEHDAGYYFGSAQAIINNNITSFNKARGVAFHNTIDSVHLIFEKWNGSMSKEHLNFYPLAINLNLPQYIKKINTNGSTLTSQYNTVTGDGDVTCDIYYIYEPDSLQNFITITSYNPATKEIGGTFQATYLIDASRPKCVPSAPDTVRIRNGQFYTKIF